MADLLLTESQIDDLLDNVIDTYNPHFWKNGEKLVCCPVHGESHPSMGVSADKGICHCFSCGFAGDFAKLLMYCQPEKFGLKTDTDENIAKTSPRAYWKAQDFLTSRYELEVHTVGKHLRRVRRYEDQQDQFLSEDERVVLPRFKLAPFMSGKETYAYFFQRGFTKADMKTYMIGRDLDNETITIPVFHEDGALAGVIGRYIDPKRRKNERYKIYFEFRRGSVLYPLNIANPIDGVAILVEGQFDAIRMHKIGYTNTFAVMTNQISRDQAQWLSEHCDTVIYIGDNDTRGFEGLEKARERLKDKVTFKTVDYPDHGKDVCDWSDEECHAVVKSAHSFSVRKLRRI